MLCSPEKNSVRPPIFIRDANQMSEIGRTETTEAVEKQRFNKNPQKQVQDE